MGRLWQESGKRVVDHEEGDRFEICLEGEVGGLAGELGLD